MMNKELIKELKPLEEKYDCNLFTFEEALEFYKSDIKAYKDFVTDIYTKFIELKKHSEDNEERTYYKGCVEGLHQGLKVLRSTFENRIDNGF